ncbi:MAG: class SAM-dependent methyltransferase [Phenylobacterium sp.]|nr:class SAM-dependent methyltransferase [Phenylobacterium sp.]
MTADPRSVHGPGDTARFQKLGFGDMRALASDPTLSEAEKMGFARGHREGFDEAIWASMLGLAPRLCGPGARVLDIGCGCGEIARKLIAQAEAAGHRLTLIDHREMLDLLPIPESVTAIAGRFPDDMPPSTDDGGFDVIIAYSVLQNVVVDANPFAFLDAALERLSPGGRLLIGDLPNFSKLRRFLSSSAGADYHRTYMRTDKAPQVAAFAPATDRIDDALLLGLMLRARLAGFDAYLLPQPHDLAFANRREDLLIERP